jgi:hypothetical protein
LRFHIAVSTIATTITTAIPFHTPLIFLSFLLAHNTDNSHCRTGTAYPQRSAPRPSRAGRSPHAPPRAAAAHVIVVIIVAVVVAVVAVIGGGGGDSVEAEGGEREGFVDAPLEGRVEEEEVGEEALAEDFQAGQAGADYADVFFY